MALSESELDPEYRRELTIIPGYDHEQRERTCRGAGASFHIRDSVKYTRRCDLPENNLELICIEIKPPKCRPFLVVDWYRPPNDPVASFDKLEQIFNFIDKEDKEIILLGDTNCDFSQHNKEQPLDNNNAKHTCNIYELFSFKQLINDPTRDALSSSTTIDHIATTAMNNFVQSGAFKTSMSDHFMVFCMRKVRGAKEKNHKVIQARSMTKFNEQAFLADVASICWDQIASQCTEIDLVMQAMVQYVF